MRNLDDIDLSQLDQMLRQLQKTPSKKNPWDQIRQSQLDQMLGQNLSTLQTPKPKKSKATVIAQFPKKNPWDQIRQSQLDRMLGQNLSTLQTQKPIVIENYQDLLLNQKLNQFEPYFNQAQKLDLNTSLSMISSQLAKTHPDFNANRFLKTAFLIIHTYKDLLEKCRKLKIKVDSTRDENERIEKLANAVQALQVRESLAIMKRLHKTIENLREKYYQKEIKLNEQLVLHQRLVKLNPYSYNYIPIRKYKQKHKKNMLSTQDYVDAMDQW